MTTPVKQYQNVSYRELLQFSQQNPNRRRALVPIEIHAPSHKEDPSLQSLGLDGYTSLNLNPTGLLSVLLCVMDPVYYSESNKNGRQQDMSDLVTSLQQDTDQLKNTSLMRKRKKIYELLGTCFNGGQLQDKDYLDLYHGFEAMRSIQFIMLKEAVQEKTEDHDGAVVNDSGFKGEIFFSSNPSLWKTDDPVWVVDYKGHWVAIPMDMSARPIKTYMGEWLEQMEQNGWMVQWPEVDGTKAELVATLSQQSTWKETDKKLSKETLALRLGKQHTLHLFDKWAKTMLLA
jgi:hypothetical protein